MDEETRCWDTEGCCRGRALLLSAHCCRLLSLFIPYLLFNHYSHSLLPTLLLSSFNSLSLLSFLSWDTIFLSLTHGEGMDEHPNANLYEGTVSFDMRSKRIDLLICGRRTFIKLSLLSYFILSTIFFMIE